MKRRYKYLAASAFALLLWLFYPVAADRLNRLYPLRLYSAEGILLREYRNSAGAYGSVLALGKYPPEVVRAVIAAEDSRFYYHPGFDPLAMLRALVDNIRHQRVRSGASTITQQLARIIYADVMPANRYLRKLVELALSARLSAAVSKAGILEAYLNQVPMPLNTTGLAAAAERIFGKHVTLLDKEEYIALVTMISRQQFVRQSFTETFMKTWKKVEPAAAPDLKKLHSLLTKVDLPRHTVPPGSEHFIDWLRENNLSAYGEIHSSISATLNQKILAIIRNEIRSLSQQGVGHAAVVVIDHSSPEVDTLRAMVGSADFGEEQSGELNHALRLRSAGSSLKPFVYALGFDRDHFSAATMFSDKEIHVSTGSANETYRPNNNDMRFWGDLTLRESLVSSRNIPAVLAVQRVGIDTFLTFLNRSGMKHLAGNAEYYGPGLALGSGGTTLLHLSRLYSGLAHRGQMRRLVIGHDPAGAEMHVGNDIKLFNSASADRITHMLKDRPLRRRAFGSRNYLDFPFPVAVKTGTSKDYHDGWTVGYTPRHTVGVWVGNSENRPMLSVSGAWGAGKIFHQVMRLVNNGARQSFVLNGELREFRICRRTGRTARDSCPSHTEVMALRETKPAPCTAVHAAEKSSEPITEIEVVSPAPGERYVLHPNESAARQEIPIIIRAPSGAAFSYSVGAGAKKPIQGFTREFAPLGQGDYTLKIYSGDAVVDEVEFSVR